MSLILNIESSTTNCSVCLSKSGEIIALKELNDSGYSHAEKLHLFINELFNDVSYQIVDIDAVAVSKGPGSYTGLRIGVSAAKGLCFALQKPLIAVDTLISLASSIKVTSGFLVPMLDARRMEVYSATFDMNFKQIQETRAQIINESSFSSYLEENKVYFLGNGAEKCKGTIKHKNAFFIDDKFPSSKEMAVLSYQKYKLNQFENIAYFEPFYLKDFIVTPQKKRM